MVFLKDKHPEATPLPAKVLSPKHSLGWTKTEASQTQDYTSGATIEYNLTESLKLYPYFTQEIVGIKFPTAPTRTTPTGTIMFPTSKHM